MVPVVGIEHFRSASKDLKTAFIQMVTPILLKYGDIPVEEVKAPPSQTPKIKKMNRSNTIIALPAMNLIDKKVDKK